MPIAWVANCVLLWSLGGGIIECMGEGKGYKYERIADDIDHLIECGRF